MGGSKQDSTSPCKSKSGGETQIGVETGKHAKSFSDPAVAFEGNSVEGDNDDDDVGTFSSTVTTGLRGRSTCGVGVSPSAAGGVAGEGSPVMCDDVGSSIATSP